MRTPFYDMAAIDELKEGEDVEKFISKIAHKSEMVNILGNVLQSPAPTKESVSITRYADYTVDPVTKAKLQQPLGQPMTRISPGELFRVQKTSNHWA